MLFDEPFALERRRNDNKLPVIAAAGQSCVSTSVTGIALLRVSFISSGEIMEKAYRLSPELATRRCRPCRRDAHDDIVYNTAQLAREVLTDRTCEIGTDSLQHRAQIHSQLIERRPAEIPISAVEIVNGQVRHERERIRHSGYAPALRRFRHVQHLDDFPFLVAQERKIRPETGPESIVDHRTIDAHHRKLAVVDRELLLKFYVVAQLHLAFASPIAAVE